jgi:hypothetical protein
MQVEGEREENWLRHILTPPMIRSGIEAYTKPHHYYIWKFFEDFTADTPSSTHFEIIIKVRRALTRLLYEILETYVSRCSM